MFLGNQNKSRSLEWNHLFVLENIILKKIIIDNIMCAVVWSLTFTIHTTTYTRTTGLFQYIIYLYYSSHLYYYYRLRNRNQNAGHSHKMPVFLCVCVMVFFYEYVGMSILYCIQLWVTCDNIIYFIDIFFCAMMIDIVSCQSFIVQGRLIRESWMDFTFILLES